MRWCIGRRSRSSRRSIAHDESMAMMIEFESRRGCENEESRVQISNSERGLDESSAGTMEESPARVEDEIQGGRVE